jgi:hypothetical protein
MDWNAFFKSLKNDTPAVPSTAAKTKFSDSSYNPKNWGIAEMGAAATVVTVAAGAGAFLYKTFSKRR